MLKLNIQNIVTQLDKSFLKLHFLINTWGTEYKTRNQVQIFSTMKCIEISEVTLTIHIDHPFITPWIWFIYVS